MTTATTTITLALLRFVNAYGPDWDRRGVLAEHAHLWVRAGGTIRRLASGTEVAVTDEGRVFPLLCGAIVWCYTEDGRTDGRCGLPAAKGRCDCEGHSAEMDGWMDMSEGEKLAWERRTDEDAMV
jgi:hypothetical protein